MPLQRCRGMRHCTAWEGRYGPAAELSVGAAAAAAAASSSSVSAAALGCGALEAQVAERVAALLLPPGRGGTEDVHSACEAALTSLLCALTLSRLQCSGGGGAPRFSCPQFGVILS